MTLKLYYHPLASFCHKVLIALYEKDIAFTPVIVDFGNPNSAAAFRKVWPMAKMPALVDEETGQTVAETSIVLDYLERRFPQEPILLPADPDDALQVRFWDRFYDFYVELPMQKIVTDRLRPEGANDAFGVEQARRAAQGSLWCDRRRDGFERMGCRRCLLHRRLRCCAGAVLCQHGRADRRKP